MGQRFMELAKELCRGVEMMRVLGGHPVFAESNATDKCIAWINKISETDMEIS